MAKKTPCTNIVFVTKMKKKALSSAKCKKKFKKNDNFINLYYKTPVMSLKVLGAIRIIRGIRMGVGVDKVSR